jgi:hypothetical protein
LHNSICTQQRMGCTMILLDDFGSTVQGSQRTLQSSIRNIWASRPDLHEFHLVMSSPSPRMAKVPESLNTTGKCRHCYHCSRAWRRFRHGKRFVCTNNLRCWKPWLGKAWRLEWLLPKILSTHENKQQCCTMQFSYKVVLLCNING